MPEEEAFASREDRVIMATNVPELGVDVVDLHQIIKVDAPSSLSSFLQRIDRTQERLAQPRSSRSSRCVIR